MPGKDTECLPSVSPSIAVYTEKFVEEAHESTLHGGTQLTMAKVRELHWVPRLRRLVKCIVKKCSGYKRFQATALTIPPPELLPRDRTKESTLFQVVGVGYASQVKYKATERREGKAYLILYACSLTRALYLDLARYSADRWNPSESKRINNKAWQTGCDLFRQRQYFRWSRSLD